MLPQVREGLLERFLRERLALRLAGADGAARRDAGQVPAALVEVEAGDVVVGGHEVEIDNALRPWSGAADRLQEDAIRAFLHEQSWRDVTADLPVAHPLFDDAGGPAEFLRPGLDGAHEGREAGEPGVQETHPVPR